MQVKILGAGCGNCHTLQDRANEALRHVGESPTAELVTDYAVIAGFGVMNTPALVVDGQVVVAGRVPGVAELVTILARD
jgi:small redox-active disulfide protein 2